MILLAFLAVFGQALAGASSSRMASGELGHVLAHAQEDGHHHHDDGGIHVDEADGSAFHVTRSEVGQIAALSAMLLVLAARLRPAAARSA
jgi:hypothetical protein